MPTFSLWGRWLPSFVKEWERVEAHPAAIAMITIAVATAIPAGVM